QVLCGVALSAEVFAAAAYGENVLSLFRFLNQTVLVAEYKIEAGDTLNGLILAEIAYGYGVVPILYQKNARESPTFMPSDNIRLIVGDRLIVLATSHSHRRIEWAELAPRNWQVHIEAILIPDTVFDGAREIAQISGVTMETARDLMHHLPATLHQPLYKHQAQSLVRKLSKLQIRAHLIPIANDISS
ncbi:MAG TPA: potassium transporter TrkA, partial [Cyanobacteria bacterium UBA8543]|nr:potassium transporter TrkA [Cyanobacteria bacterium UBA8543]